MRKLATALGVATLVAPVILRLGMAVHAQQPCLHSGQEAPDQQSRRRAALTLTRQINTLEARARAARGEFIPVADLGVAATPDGWDVHFATDRTRYSFAIKDTLDACHFAYFSDEVGLIYNATPLQ